MARLSEVRQQGQQIQQGPTRQMGGLQGLGTVSAGVAYPFPIDARYKGQNVRITVLANIEGLSPAKEIVFEDGSTDWVSIDDQDLRITDPRVVPLGNDQQRQLLQGGRPQQ